MATRPPETPQRAKRFPVSMPLRYRDPQTRQWKEARTENVSRTGVLFWSDGEFEPTTKFDVRLSIPPAFRVGDYAEILCKCEVVRTEPASAASISPAVAAVIHRYRFRRKQPFY